MGTIQDMSEYEVHCRVRTPEGWKARAKVVVAGTRKLAEIDVLNRYGSGDCDVTDIRRIGPVTATATTART